MTNSSQLKRREFTRVSHHNQKQVWARVSDSERKMKNLSNKNGKIAVMQILVLVIGIVAFNFQLGGVKADITSGQIVCGNLQQGYKYSGDPIAGKSSIMSTGECVNWCNNYPSTEKKSCMWDKANTYCSLGKGIRH